MVTPRITYEGNAQLRHARRHDGPRLSCGDAGCSSGPFRSRRRGAIMTKVAIIGATGPTGIHLAAELHKTGAAVRVVARGMDKLTRLFPDAAVEKRSAEILDP